MAEPTEPLTSTYDAFGAARGDRADESWAYAVSWRLLSKDVDVDLVREGLEEARVLVLETQESPAGLFGPPADHAEELYGRWVEEGRLRLAGRGAIAWRDVPSSGLAWSAFFCVAFAVIMAAQGDSPLTWTLGVVLIPLSLGLGTVAALALYGTVLERRGTLIGVISATTCVAAMAAVVAGLNEWSQGHPFGTDTVWWYVPAAVGCALLATSWRRWTATWPATVPPVAQHTDDWSARLAALLRARHSLSDARVATILAEARGHAAASGRSVQEEFGAPEEYAARFRPDLARRSRLLAWFYVLLSTMNVIAIVDGPTWYNVGAAFLLAWMAWTERRTYLDLRATER